MNSNAPDTGKTCLTTLEISSQLYDMAADQFLPDHANLLNAAAERLDTQTVTINALRARCAELDQARTAPAAAALTEAMIDAPRQFLAFYACAHRSIRTGEMRRYLDLSGVDYSCWPEWAKVGDISITKAGAAILTWTLMQAAAGAGQEGAGHD